MSAPFDPRFLDDLAKRLAGSVPQGLLSLRQDVEQNFKAILQAGLARMKLVTREEFDVQTAVLQRTREKLEALEARVAVLAAADGAGAGGGAASKPPGLADGERRPS